MRRRTFLRWSSRGLAAFCAAIVALPGVSFILDVLRHGQSNGDLTRRVARLKDLPLNKPVRVPIIGTRRDAWTEYPSEVLGQVWLVRRKANATELASETDQIAAFTATCPHLGCLIQHEPKLNSFLCPCHRARFGQDGQRLSSTATGQNHAPRGMDALECRLVQDDATQEVWVEVTFQKFEQGLSKQVLRA